MIFGRLIIVAGIEPTNWLLFNHNTLRCLRVPKLSGIVPVNWHFSAWIISRYSISDRLDGSSPINSFSHITKFVILFKIPILAGIVPVKRLFEIPNWVNRVNFNISSGKGPIYDYGKNIFIRLDSTYNIYNRYVYSHRGIYINYIYVNT